MYKKREKRGIKKRKKQEFGKDKEKV